MGRRARPSDKSKEMMRRLFWACALTGVLLAGATAFGQPVGTARAVGPASDTDTGFLDVSSEPSGAKILIDDADLGQTTPQHHMAVRVGHHRLTLVTSDGAHKLTVGFSVEAGQTKKLTLYLAK
jgi:PEGA domain